MAVRVLCALLHRWSVRWSDHNKPALASKGRKKEQVGATQTSGTECIEDTLVCVVRADG